jgi:prephenate dehydrogenase
MLIWNRITIVGCGLIGASFALALKRGGACRRIAGWDSSPAVLNEALRRGIIDERDHLEGDGGPSASDLIYLAMPVAEIINFLRASSGRIKPGALVTDAGSTKLEVCRAAAAYLPEEVRFIGGHPIAGSHLSGNPHARADIFDQAPYVLTYEPGHQGGPESRKLSETIELTGARVIWLTAAEHDRALAWLSHLPQLLSSALASTIETKDEEAPLALAGKGYRDMTRLAGSAWSMWGDILATNPRPIAHALDEMIERLSAVRDELQGQAEGPTVALPVSRALFERSCQQLSGVAKGQTS